jgi:hypothetical protein
MKPYPFSSSQKQLSIAFASSILLAVIGSYLKIQSVDPSISSIFLVLGLILFFGVWIISILDSFRNNARLIVSLFLISIPYLAIPFYLLKRNQFINP